MTLSLLPQKPSDVASKLAIMNAAEDLLAVLISVIQDLENDIDARRSALYSGPVLTDGEVCFNRAIMCQVQRLQSKLDAAHAAIAKARGAA